MKRLLLFLLVPALVKLLDGFSLFLFVLFGFLKLRLLGVLLVRFGRWLRSLYGFFDNRLDNRFGIGRLHWSYRGLSVHLP